MRRLVEVCIYGLFKYLCIHVDLHAVCCRLVFKCNTGIGKSLLISNINV